MRADGEVVQLATSWLPASIAGGTRIEQVDTGDGGTYARLEELGHRLVRFIEIPRARRATAEEAAHLSIPLGAPVMQVTRIASTEEGSVEVTRMVMDGDRYELVYGIDA